MNRIALLMMLAVFSFPSISESKEVKFRQFSVLVNGVKFWMPSVITVNEGDDVEVEIVSKVPGKNSVHGYTIDAFKIKEVATTTPKTIKFKATKSGIFPITCHLHPAHIGGQLVVLED